MEKSAQISGDIIDDGLISVDQGEDQAGLPCVFPAFVEVAALLHLKGKRHLIGIAHAAEDADIFLVREELRVRGEIVQPDIDL